jgi:16S rRNA (cytosine1402-N4)-methyltransferase
MEYHNPVLLKETVGGLNIRPDGVYVDVTFGGGGHSREIMKRLGPNGKLFAFDQDEDAQANVIDDERFTLIPENFRFLKGILGFMVLKR